MQTTNINKGRVWVGSCNHLIQCRVNCSSFHWPASGKEYWNTGLDCWSKIFIYAVVFMSGAKKDKTSCFDFKRHKCIRQ